MGQVGQVGPDAYNARRCMLAAGLPPTTTAMNVNRLCSSGLQAIVTASQQVQLGDAGIVVAGGNESMSRQPFLDYQARDGWRLGTHQLVDGTLSLLTDPWGHYLMGVTAENVAERYDVDRAAQDRFAARSQELAQAAARLRRAGRRDRPDSRAGPRRAVRPGRASASGRHDRVARQAAGRVQGRRQRHRRQLVRHQRRRRGAARDGRGRGRAPRSAAAAPLPLVGGERRRARGDGLCARLCDPEGGREGRA